MNLIPFCVIVVLNKRPRYSNVRTHRRNHRVVSKGAASRLCVGLRYPVVADDLEDQFDFLSRDVDSLSGRAPAAQQLLSIA